MKKLFISLFITLLLSQNQAYAFSTEITDEAKEKIIYTKRNIYFIENAIKNSSDLIQLGILYKNIGKDEKALELVNSALKKEPNNYSAVILLSELNFRKYNFKEAKALLEKIPSTSNEYKKALGKRFELALVLSDLDYAKEVIERAKETQDEEIINYVEGLFNYSRFSMSPDKALVNFEKVVSINPNNVYALYYLASLNLDKDRRKDSRKILEELLNKDFFNSRAHSLLGFIDFLDKNMDMSVKDSKMALEINRFEKRALINLGCGMTNKTYEDLESANTNLKAEEIFFETGKKLSQLINQNSQEEAKKLIADLIKKYPNNIHTYIHAGSFYILTKEYEKAIESYQKALKISADYGLANNGLSEALRNYNKSQEKDTTKINLEVYDYSLIDKIALRKIFVNYDFLPEEDQKTILYSVFLMRKYLPLLAEKGATHYLIPIYEKLTDHEKASYIRGKRTFDGRLWDDVRGMGGFDSATGIEDLELARSFDFNTLTHEFTHQVHGNVLKEELKQDILNLYQNAKKKNLFLDYYSTSNEYEYFAQCMEAYVSFQGKKNPKSTAKNTRASLKEKDPEMYKFIEEKIIN